MSVTAKSIDDAFNAKAKLSFLIMDSVPHWDKSFEITPTVEGNYKSFRLTCAQGTVKLQEVTVDTGDGVNVLYQDQSATYGHLSGSGWIYSDSFSGCVFYLYRSLKGEVFGVHAARSSGKLADPEPVFKANACKLLYRFDTVGTMSGAKQGMFAAVLCKVGLSEIDVWFVARKGDDTVAEVVDRRTIPNWRNYELTNPAALRRVVPVTVPTPPRHKKKGWTAWFR